MILRCFALLDLTFEERVKWKMEKEIEMFEQSCD